MWNVWGKREKYTGLRLRNLTKKKPLRIPRNRGEDDIKMDVEKIEYCVE